jgi:hypothetical protein
VRAIRRSKIARSTDCKNVAQVTSNHGISLQRGRAGILQSVPYLTTPETTAQPCPRVPAWQQADLLSAC